MRVGLPMGMSMRIGFAGGAPYARGASHDETLVPGHKLGCSVCAWGFRSGKSTLVRCLRVLRMRVGLPLSLQVVLCVFKGAPYARGASLNDYYRRNQNRGRSVCAWGFPELRRRYAAGGGALRMRVGLPPASAMQRTAIKGAPYARGASRT